MISTIRRVWLAFLMVLGTSHMTYAAKSQFYWMPHMSYGALYRCSTEISGKWSTGLLWGGQYQFSPRLAIALMRHRFFRFENKAGDIHTAFSWDLTAKHCMDPIKIVIFSRTIQGYGQWGGWYACSKIVMPSVNKKLPLYSSGLVFGIGAYCEVLPYLLLDVSLKRLQAIPALNDIGSTHLFTLGVGVRL